MRLRSIADRAKKLDAELRQIKSAYDAKFRERQDAFEALRKEEFKLTLNHAIKYGSKRI